MRPILGVSSDDRDVVVHTLLIGELKTEQGTNRQHTVPERDMHVYWFFRHFKSSEGTSAIQVRGEELDSSAAELELVDPVISLFEEIKVFQPCACRQAPVWCCRATDACSLSLRCVFSLCTHLDAHHHFMLKIARKIPHAFMVAELSL